MEPVEDGRADDLLLRLPTLQKVRLFEMRKRKTGNEHDAAPLKNVPHITTRDSKVILRCVYKSVVRFFEGQLVALGLPRSSITELPLPSSGVYSSGYTHDFNY